MKNLSRCLVLLLLYSLTSSARAQVFTFSREQMVKYTAKNPYERFPDGRPKVPDQLLEKLKAISSEEAWEILRLERFTQQFEKGFQILHPERKLIGRAVTAQFMPFRPDVADVNEAEAKAKGLPSLQNERAIDILLPGDVLVVDLFGKVEEGEFIGDNLAAAIYSLTKTGFVIDGGIRDLEGILPLDLAGYYRGAHPSSFSNVMLMGVNIPIRIGKATVMPGDIVFGDREGITFIPPHLVQGIVTKAEDTHIHDEWTRSMFLTGRFKSSDLYPYPADPALRKEYEEYVRKRKQDMK